MNRSGVAAEISFSNGADHFSFGPFQCPNCCPPCPLRSGSRKARSGQPRAHPLSAQSPVEPFLTLERATAVQCHYHDTPYFSPRFGCEQMLGLGRATGASFAGILHEHGPATDESLF